MKMKMVMMMKTGDDQGVHHHDDNPNQHRQFLSQRDGPTSTTNHVIYDVVGAQTLHQPFDHNTTANTINTAFKPPGGDNMVAAGFPFTGAQWKELERQAMIYKYMMASIPVPIDLLLPMSTTTTTTTNLSTNSPSSAPNLRYTNGKADMEPGRCKRTDGKKWRCSRDVAPNQKYCERHMNRGRPRSRKHVEQQQFHHLNHNPNNINHQNNNNNNNNSNKRTRHSHDYNNTTTNITLPISSTGSTIMSQSHFLGDSSTSMPSYHHYPCVNVSSPVESRSLEWMMMKTEQQLQQQHDVVPMAASDPTWLHLMQTKMDVTHNPNQEKEEEEEPFLNLNSYANCQSQEQRGCALFLNHSDGVVSDPPPRSFIDAWSQTTAKTAVDHETTQTLANDIRSNKTCSVSSSLGNLSPSSSLTLSMGNRASSIADERAYDETLRARVSNPGCWVSPLAEVLRPSAAASEPPSPFAGSPAAAAAKVVSSPSGVLQKTAMASLSDSSNCSSPGVGGSSLAKPEIALL